MILVPYPTFPLSTPTTTNANHPSLPDSYSKTVTVSGRHLPLTEPIKWFPEAICCLRFLPFHGLRKTIYQNTRSSAAYFVRGLPARSCTVRARASQHARPLLSPYLGVLDELVEGPEALEIMVNVHPAIREQNQRTNGVPLLESRGQLVPDF